MDLQPTEEQRSLMQSVREFGRSLNRGLAERDSKGTFDRQAWRSCADFGIQGLPIPETYGGSGRDLTTAMLAMLALGHACRDNGLVFSLNAQICACELPILRFGTEEQRRRWLPGLCSGELIGAHAITEPESGSDAMALSTRAVRDGDFYVLDGSKTFITNAPVADLLLVFATVNPAMRMAGVTGFLIERNTPGLTLSAPMSKLGLHTSPMGEVVLEGCRVPASSRLGAEGAGMAVFNGAMGWERTCIFASHLGAMERLLEDTVAYAKTRRQFGSPISRFAPIAEKLVDMKVAIEAGRLLLYKVAQTVDTGGDATLDAAIAKLFISEAHVREALAAIQIHGAYGFMTEQQIERELRDAIPGTIYSGTSEMQRKIIARLLGL